MSSIVGACTNQFGHLKLETIVKTIKIVCFGQLWPLFLAILEVVQTGHEWYTPFLIISYVYLPIYTIIGVCNNHFRHLKCEIIGKTLKIVNFGHFLAIFAVV